MIKFFRHIKTIIANEVWQSFKLEFATSILPRRLVPRNDKILLYDKVF